MSILLGNNGPILNRNAAPPTSPLSSSFFRPLRLNFSRPPTQQPTPSPSGLGLLLNSVNTGSKLLNLLRTDPNTSGLSSAASGLGALGSVAGLIGNATNNRTLANAGSAAGIAGRGVQLGSNIASGAPLSANIGSGAGLVGSALGLAGSLSGNRDVSLAGNTLGAASSLYGLGSGLAGATASTAAATGTGTAGLAAAGLSTGAAAGIAGGVLAIPTIVKMLLDQFAPTWVGRSHYDQTRAKAAAQAEGGIGMLNDVFGQAARFGDPRFTQQALSAGFGQNGAVRSSFNPAPEVATSLGLPEGRNQWGSMSPQQFSAVMNWLSQDPSRLSTIGGSGDIPYLPQWEAQYYADKASDQAKNLIARQTGLPYYFLEPEHQDPKDFHGYETVADPKRIQFLSKKEGSYKQARDQWAAAHPNVKLDDWKPIYLGNEDALTRAWLESNYREHGAGVG